MSWDKIFFTHSAAETVELLQEYNGTAQVIAGGTDLMIQLKQRLVNAKVLVDTGRIRELNYLSSINGRIHIGAMATHSRLAAAPELQTQCSVLADAARSIGSPQIRNVGTIGGNVVNAQPAADAVIALLALDARVHILTGAGKMEKTVEETFLGPGKSIIDPTRELVTSFSFKAPGALENTAFARHARRAALALPVLNVGVWLRLNEPGDSIAEIRIAMGPMATVPFRARETERFLQGAHVNEATLREAAELAVSEVQPRDSFRGSAAYKKEMVSVFLKRAILAAMGKGVKT